MNVRLQYTANFNAGIYYNGQMQMNNYVAKIYMLTNTPDGIASNVALDRIKHFIYTQIDSSIFIDSEDQEQCQKYVAANLNVTTFPGGPVDQLVGIMLYYKLKAITEDRMLIGEVEISSTLGEGLIYIHGDNESVNDVTIPDWWESVDLVHCDRELIDSPKVVNIQHTSVWRDLDLAWPDIEDDTPEDHETGNTVVFADFKRLDDTE
jgi:hypothetical protein